MIESFVPELCLDPPKKKIELPLKSKSRLVSPTVKEKFSEATKGVVTENTKKNNSWAEKTSFTWAEERNMFLLHALLLSHHLALSMLAPMAGKL